MPRSGPTHAIVIGAGMGGLIAARILADHYGRDTILERDVLPPDPEPRRGVPHGRHAHGLLARGREALEEMFPGLTDELVQAGATLTQGPADAIVHMSGVYFASAQGGLRGVILSRPMLETHVRRRLLGHRHVSIHERALVQTLIADGDRITGVDRS